MHMRTSSRRTSLPVSPRTGCGSAHVWNRTAASRSHRERPAGRFSPGCRTPPHHPVPQLVGPPLGAGQRLCGGVLDRHPDLRPRLAHGGGYWPYQFGRLDRGHAVRRECRGAAQAPRAYLRAFYYDTVVHSAEALRYLIGLVGADRVLLGTDMPFDMGDPEPLVTLDGTGVTPQERQAIAHDNAASLFRIK